jgi:superfamily II DNA or RNA helicase/HKD family nuclease
MAQIGVGLYEALLTEAWAQDLAALTSELEAQTAPIRAAEAHDRIALHVARLVERAIRALPEAERSAGGVSLARDLIDRICARLDLTDWTAQRPVPDGLVLEAVTGRRPDGRAAEMPRPLTPLLDTCLMTNATGEPRIGAQIASEIPSAHRIDLVMAFIRWTGVRDLLEPLRMHCGAGRPLRVLTTTYTASTEPRALEALRALGAQIRVSYDISGTRLHAKAWLFHRDAGVSTAYIGSSNLTMSAQTTGLEWNLRVAEARNPVVVERVRAVFASYWASSDFEDYEPQQFVTRLAAQRASGGDGGSLLLSPTEVRPEPFQSHLLEQIGLARAHGRHRNLLVSATGTGKTVMAALDYASLRQTLPRARLLFVAHREEILDQSRRTFAQVLRDPAFGEMWVGGQRPAAFEHVFASIQSLDANGLVHLSRDHFDVVIVDEFHHAAARSYEALLDRVEPVELLGLTATPERSDGLSILHWFGGRIAAELRIWDAIDQRRLVPFAYYGIHDGLDLRDLPWRRGRGYDVDGLTQLLTTNDAWARLVFQQLQQKLGALGDIRALGFCVSVDHARFMARLFNQWGLPAVAVWSDTPDVDRRAALRALADRTVNVVFSVDLFNEGVDLPTVDTLLMLRPTDSPTLFLQQLGRGLRRAPGKSLCTVLDFVGHHHREFRFERKLNALFNTSRKRLEAQVEQGFPFMPAGCSMHLDRVARDVVLRSIREGVARTWKQRVDALVRVRSEQPDADLSTFLDETGISLAEVFTGEAGRTWFGLQRAAGQPFPEDGPAAEAATLDKALGRLLHLDDPRRLACIIAWASAPTPPEVSSLTRPERRLLRMLVTSLVGSTSLVSRDAPLAAGLALLWRHPRVLADLRALCAALRERVTHLPIELTTPPDVPLVIHARYARDEILAAYGEGDALAVPEWREGVRFMKGAQVDAFLLTLDKTGGGFSPTTRYNDYAISPTLIHWESQSVTRAASPTGQRYQHHVARGSHVHLFARLSTDERAFYFLGPATYVSHDGEMPMKITWRLTHPLSGDLFATFAAAVA